MFFPHLTTWTGHNGERLRTQVAEGSTQSLPKSRQVRPAPGALAGLLSRPAAAHHRRRAVAPESHRCDERAAALPENPAAARLFKSPALRREEGLLLPGRQREAQ